MVDHSHFGCGQRRRWALHVLHGVLFPVLFFSCLAGAQLPCRPARAAAPVTALAFAPDGVSVVVGSQDGLEVRGWPALDVVRSLDTELVNIHDVAFSPKGQTLAVAGGAPAEDGIVELYSWPASELLRRVRHHDDLVYDVAWRGDGAAWASAAADRLARVEHVDGENEILLTGHSRGVTSVSWLAGENVLVTGGLDHSLRVWNGATGELLRALDNHTEPVLGLAVRPAKDDTLPPMLASISRDRTVRLWQPTIGRMVRFVRLSVEPLAVAWSHDGRHIIVACADGKVRVIDPDTVGIAAELPAIDGWAYSLAVAPTNDLVLVGGTGGQLRKVKWMPTNPP